MKRISEFTEERIDMKQMAATVGGTASSSTFSQRTYDGCGDVWTCHRTDQVVFIGDMTVTIVKDVWDNVDLPCS
jgi:hypothetical protein